MRRFFRWHTNLSYRQQVSCTILAAIILATLLLYCLGISSFLVRQGLIESRFATAVPPGLPVPVDTALPVPTATSIMMPLTPPPTESP